MMVFGASRLKNIFRQDVAEGLKNEVSLTTLTLADIENLPEPVKKYIIYSGSIGKPKVHHLFIEFRGQIRKNAQSAWMPFVSEQYNFMHIPARLFFMKATMNHLTVAGYHRYMNGVAFMDIRLFSLFRVQYQSGREMGIAETVTFFNDMCCMAPATLIDERITWGKEKDNSIEAIFTVNDISITAILFLMTKASW